MGIDVERIYALDEMDEIARRFFAPGDLQHLRALPALAQQAAFFDLWTRREACAKAIGQGLSAFTEGVSPSTDRSTAPGRTMWSLSAGPRCTLHELCPGAGYAAALAVQGRCRQIECWQFALLESEHM